MFRLVTLPPQKMNHFTEDDIEKMRSRGYEPTTINEARVALVRSKLADELIERIATAFHGVVLGSGIGLQEAQGLDDYEDEETCATYRASDEKENWQSIPFEDLNKCHSSLSFFDAEGMRFHLPAYMTAELRGQFHFGMSSCLTRADEHGRSYFTTLDSFQRSTVREFLLFLRDDPEYVYDRYAIDFALDNLWVDVEML